MPKVSPNSSLKNGPMTPVGRVWRMSPTFLRTWYQMSATASGGVDCFRSTKIVVWPGRGEAAQAVEVVGLLQRALQPLGHLLHGLLDGRAGPGGRDHHGAEGEGRVLAAAQAVNDSVPATTATIIRKTISERFEQRPLGEIGADHDCRPQQAHLLAGTQRLHAGGHDHVAAASGPEPTCTVVALELRTSMLRSETVPAVGIDHPDGGLPSARISAAAGISMPGAAVELHAPGHRAAQAHRGGGSISRTRTAKVPVTGSARGRDLAHLALRR